MRAPLERGELDLCFSIFPLPDGPFETIKLIDDPFVVVVANDDPLLVERQRKPLALADLRKMPLVTFCAGRSVEQFEAFVRSRGVELNVVFRSNYNGTVQGMAAGGGVAALAALLTMNTRSPDTKFLKLGGVPPRVLGLTWHRDRFRARSLDAFVEVAREVCEELAKSGDGLLSNNGKARIKSAPAGRNLRRS